MTTICIKDLDKAEVLAALYNASIPLGMGHLQFQANAMTKEEAQVYLDAGHLRFDYLKGRVMKVDLNKDDLWVALYDRDNGEGAARRALAHLLEG